MLLPNEPVEAPPRIVSTPPLSASVDQLYVYPVVAEDPDGNITGFELTQAPTGMRIDATSGLVSWTPAQPGQVEVTVAAVDATGLRGEQRFVITVGAVPGLNPPEWQSPAALSAPLGRTTRFQFVAVDADGEAVTYAVEPLPLPAGMRIDALSGALEFTPALDQVGAHVLQLAAFDGRFRIEQALTITVPAPDGPTRLHGRVQQGIETPLPGVRLVIGEQVRVSDADGYFQFEDLPTGGEVSVLVDGADAQAAGTFATAELGVRSSIDASCVITHCHGYDATMLDLTPFFCFLLRCNNARLDPFLLISQPRRDPGQGAPGASVPPTPKPASPGRCGCCCPTSRSRRRRGSFQRSAGHPGFRNTGKTTTLSDSNFATPSRSRLRRSRRQHPSRAEARQSWTLRVLLPNEPVDQPPRIVSTPPLSASVDQLYVYPVQAEDPDGNIAGFELVEAPDEAPDTQVSEIRERPNGSPGRKPRRTKPSKPWTPMRLLQNPRKDHADGAPSAARWSMRAHHSGCGRVFGGVVVGNRRFFRSAGTGRPTRTCAH